MNLINSMKEIRAFYNDETIRVYQAYNKTIAEEAVRNRTIGAHFSMNRMTWIKPSFLWMMYRCGWGEKENRERIIAIDIKRSGFQNMKELIDVVTKFVSYEELKREQVVGIEIKRVR